MIARIGARAMPAWPQRGDGSGPDLNRAQIVGWIEAWTLTWPYMWSKMTPVNAARVLAVLAVGLCARAASGAGCFVQVVGGDSHTLALHVDGTVWAWGQNSQGELGNGTTVNSLVPIQVPGVADVVWIGNE